ncbi:hypothetical protein OQA88_8294 [Cercophora sp. LCS_1]
MADNTTLTTSLLITPLTPSPSPTSETEPEPTFPPLCFPPCNTAYEHASSASALSPDLCSPASLYITSLLSCTTCISSNTASQAEAAAVQKAYINPRFAPYLNYCAGLTPDSESPVSGNNTTPPAEEYTLIVTPVLGTITKQLPIPTASDQASLESKWSSIGSIASSGGYFVVPTDLMIVTTETIGVTRTRDGVVETGNVVRTRTVPDWDAWDFTPAPAASETVAPPGGGGSGNIGRVEGGQNGGLIAGVVVGVLVVIGVVVGMGFWWMRRRRREVAREETGVMDKAQLHGDCVVRPMTPREMEVEKKTFWQMDEMAANEPAAVELPGDEKWVADVKRGSGSTWSEGSRYSWRKE